MTVGVLYGGRSAEHDVSVLSAKTVLRALASRYRVYPIYVSREGIWHHVKEDETLTDALSFSFGGNVSDGETTERIDCVFSVLHGVYGEDGRAQGFFDTLGIPYVGCGCEASAICMDKAMVKMIAKSAGIPQAKALIAERNFVLPDDFPDVVGEKLGYPVFVKPAHGGSSIGVSRVTEPDDLASAMETAFACDEKILIEEAIAGREIEVGVIAVGNRLTVSEPGEVLHGGDFYSYDEKYKKESKWKIPAPLPKTVAACLKTLSARLFRLFGCRGYGRFDFLVPPDGKIRFNEANTLPGFTENSMFPRLMATRGMNLDALLHTLVENAIRN